MNQKIKSSLLGFLLLLNLQANAQEFYVNNNSEIKALASKNEITRIAFDSPVTEVHAISEEIEYVIQAQDIYLRMLAADKPIDFFIKCEDDSTYKLLLIAQDAPGTQIFIHNKSVSSKNLAKTEYFGDISPELKTRITKIIDVSLNPTKHLGYSMNKKNSYLQSQIKTIKIQLDNVVSGNQLIAEKIRVTNKVDKAITLNLQDFADSKYLAIYLTKTNLLPTEEAILIRISEN
jgi:hypothetical protein